MGASEPDNEHIMKLDVFILEVKFLIFALTKQKVNFTMNLLIGIKLEILLKEWKDLYKKLFDTAN